MHAWVGNTFSRINALRAVFVAHCAELCFLGVRVCVCVCVCVCVYAGRVCVWCRKWESVSDISLTYVRCLSRGCPICMHTHILISKNAKLETYAIRNSAPHMTSSHSTCKLTHTHIYTTGSLIRHPPPLHVPLPCRWQDLRNPRLPSQSGPPLQQGLRRYVLRLNQQVAFWHPGVP